MFRIARSGVCSLLLLQAGCVVQHIPPPAHPGAPMTPVTSSAGGLDVGVGGEFLLYLPVAYHARAAKAVSLGEGPLSLELGGNLGSGWAAVNPALHWTPRPRPGSDWHLGLRMGLVAGAGDILGTQPLADPFLGGSLHAQSTWANDRGRALTGSLGWGYAGHTRCMGGCSYGVPQQGGETGWCSGDDPDNCETVHSYIPYNAPSLHLRADLPVGHEGHAVFLGFGTQPIIDGTNLLPVFELSAGLNHRDPGPSW